MTPRLVPLPEVSGLDERLLFEPGEISVRVEPLPVSNPCYRIRLL
ncbi:MAG: hypothetical protein WB782_07040 [Thermoplasmata archaeon]